MDTNENFRQALIATLRETRKERGLSHEKIAEKANISRQTLGKIESGQTNPTMLTMFKILTAMDVPFDDFVKRLKI